MKDIRGGDRSEVAATKVGVDGMVVWCCSGRKEAALFDGYAAIWIWYLLP